MTARRSKAKDGGERAPAAEPKPRAKDRITLYFRRELLEEARGAVLELGRQGKRPHSLSELFDAALERELKRLRNSHNDGEPFEGYIGPFPGGRPRSR